MITRIVKMTFMPGRENEFLEVFREASPLINNFEGCSGLELIREKPNGNIFFTISTWESEEFLNNYRSSQLFKDTWEKTKRLFQEKAEAWTTEIVK